MSLRRRNAQAGPAINLVSATAREMQRASRMNYLAALHALTGPNGPLQPISHAICLSELGHLRTAC